VKKPTTIAEAKRLTLKGATMTADETNDPKEILEAEILSLFTDYINQYGHIEGEALIELLKPETMIKEFLEKDISKEKGWILFLFKKYKILTYKDLIKKTKLSMGKILDICKTLERERKIGKIK